MTSRHQPSGFAAASGPSYRRSPSLRVLLVLETPDLSPPLKGWLPRELKRIAALAGVDGGAVTVAVVDDARMSELHERYKGVAGTTDVLSFDLRDDAAGPVEGDLVVCLDEARRQAARREHEPRLEVLLYAVHGLLHLLGYDDHAPRDAAAMHREEDRLLTEAGFGPVYRAGGSRRRAAARGRDRK